MLNKLEINDPININLSDSMSTEYDLSDTYLVDSNKIYSISDKKLIVSKIDKIKNKKLYLKIFKIIHLDKCNYTINSNGIFFNITNINNNTLYKIDQLINKYEKIHSSKYSVNYQI
jgi:hypothetical protein